MSNNLLKFDTSITDTKFLSNSSNQINKLQYKSIKEKVTLLLVRDLIRLKWNLNTKSGVIILSPPDYYNKIIIKQSMIHRREEIILENLKWIDNYIEFARNNLAKGIDVLNSKIKPRIEICKNRSQHNLFRIFRYFWSSPYSEYVGRRIRLIIRDDGIQGSPVIGILALGSSIIHIPDRDKWIGWNKSTRTENLINTMDIYVLGALPPYNYLLGGKLISYISSSNEVRNIFIEKYKGKNTIIMKRKKSDLACLFTTSLYGRSSLYNRIKYNKKLIFIPIGSTSGYGTLHISNETFSTMLQLLKDYKISITNNFGDGPNWRMRVIRTTSDLLGFNSDVLLKHSFRRNLYAIPMMKNYRSFLCEKIDIPIYYNRPLKELVEYWRKRWLEMRKKNNTIINNVLKFKPKDFNISLN